MGRQNALWNVKNPNQGDSRRILTVCSAGLLRSPTVAARLVMRGYNARSCGVHDYALVKLDEVLVEWADVILFMTRDHLSIAEYDHDIKKKDHLVLNIEDDYDYMQPVLVDLVDAILDEYGFTGLQLDRSTPFQHFTSSENQV